MSQIASSFNSGVFGSSKEISIIMSAIAIISLFTGLIKDMRHMSFSIRKLFADKFKSHYASRAFNFLSYLWSDTHIKPYAIIEVTTAEPVRIRKSFSDENDNNAFYKITAKVSGREYRFVAVSQTEIKPGENYKLNNLSLMAKQELESAHNSTQAAAENSFSLKTQAFGEKYTPFSLTPTQQTPASQGKTKYLMIILHTLSKLSKLAIDWVILMAFSTLGIGLNSSLSVFTLIFALLIAGIILVEDPSKSHASTINQWSKKPKKPPTLNANRLNPALCPKCCGVVSWFHCC